MSFSEFGQQPFIHSSEVRWGQPPDRTLALLDQLPGEPGRELRLLVKEICSRTQIHPTMVLPTLISGMASAVYGSRIIQCPDGREEPVSCFTVVLAPSTTGKTRLHRLLHKAHEEHDTREYLRAEDQDANTQPGKARVRRRPVLVQDTSLRGLMERLRGVGEAVSFSMSEGLPALMSPLFRGHLGNLNSLYDGGGSGPLLRGNNTQLFIRHATLNLLIMVQPGPFGDYMKSFGKYAHEIGFFSRCMFAIVPPATGNRDIFSSTDNGLIDKYFQRVNSLLAKRSVELESGVTDQTVITFDQGATELWQSLAAGMQHAPTGQPPFMQEVTNRSMSNAARIAGALHAFFGDSCQLTRDFLHVGWLIVQWHLEQYREQFQPGLAPVPMIPPRANLVLSPRQKQEQREREDGSLILEKIEEQCRLMFTDAALKSKVCIRSGLYSARFRTALMRLVDQGMVIEIGTGARAQLKIRYPLSCSASASSV